MSAIRPRHIVASADRVRETLRATTATLLGIRALRLDMRRLACENANVLERLDDAEARNRLKRQLLDHLLGSRSREATSRPGTGVSRAL